MTRLPRLIVAGLAGLVLVAGLAGCGAQPASSAPVPKSQPTRAAKPPILSDEWIRDFGDRQRREREIRRITQDEIQRQRRP